MTACLIFLGFQVEGHSVSRSAIPQYSFSVSDNQSSLTDQDVQFLFSVLSKVYAPLLNNKEKSWTNGYDWTNPYLGAGSKLDGDDFSVMLWGGFVRSRGMNLGALAATLCHEVGHRLGGAPFQKFPGSDPDWSSAEGQSDYFAATNCLPQIYKIFRDQFPARLENTELENFSISLCQNSADISQCRWVAQAGVDLIEMLQLYFDLNAPLANAANWTNELAQKTLFTAYPTAQCRMDIYKSGAENSNAQRLPCWYQE